MTGYISQSGDVDYFALDTPGGTKGTIIFTLQVSNANEQNYYFLDIYGSSGTVLVQTTTSVKTVTLPANAGPFIIKAYRSGTGYSTTTRYTISISSTAVTSVPLYVQETGSTCGAASVRMILASYGLNYTEKEIADKTYDLVGNQWSYAYAQSFALNHYLGAAGMSTRYQYTDMGSSTQGAYDTRLWNNVANGYPVLVVLNITDTAYFPYKSPGHYVVVKGLSRSSTQNNVTVNDPHNIYSAVYDLPASALKAYGDAHSGFVIYVNN